MKFEYLLPQTRRFLFDLADAYESSGGNISDYHNRLDPILKKYPVVADEYAETLVRLNYVGNTRLLIPTEAGLHYKKLRRIYLADRFLTPAIVSFITTLATMAATYFAVNVPHWFKDVLMAIQSVSQ